MNTLKEHQTRLAKIREEKKLLQLDKNRLGERIRLLNSQENELIKTINNFSGPGKELVVTEHAILRYLERVKGVDLDEIKSEIYTDYLKDLYSKLPGGKGEFPASNEPGALMCVIENNKIITVKT